MTVNKLKKNFGTNFIAAPVFIAMTLFLAVQVPAVGKTAVEWDFSKGLHGWTGNARVENLSSSPEGLLVISTGEDPWIEGPAVDLPGDKIIRAKIRMRSNADAGAELFYGRVFQAGDSVRFTTQTDGNWHDYSLVIRDKLGPGTRFRLDPCVGAGSVTVAWIKIETISEILVPSLEKPGEPDRTSERRTSVKSGGLEFEHYEGTWGNFALKVNGAEMAAGYQSEPERTSRPGFRRAAGMALSQRCRGNLRQSVYQQSEFQRQ